MQVISFSKIRSFLPLLMIFCSFQLAAQIKVTGKLITKDKTPIEFAEIILLNKDSMGVKSELANEDGTFTVSTAAGRYTIQQIIFFTGY